MVNNYFKLQPILRSARLVNEFVGPALTEAFAFDDRDLLSTSQAFNAAQRALSRRDDVAWLAVLRTPAVRGEWDDWLVIQPGAMRARMGVVGELLPVVKALAVAS